MKSARSLLISTLYWLAAPVFSGPAPMTVTPGASAPQFVSSHGPSSGPADFSARFLPVRIYPKDAAQIELFRQLASHFHLDSTCYWRLKDGRIEISYGLIQEITQGNVLVTPGGGVPIGGFGAGVTDFLSKVHGLGFRSATAGYGQYIPDDKWFLECPQWSLQNPGTAIANRPGKVGMDIDITPVWDKFSGADTLVIAVVDAGFNFKHPDMKGNHWINQAEANGKPGVDDDGNGYVDDSIGWDFVENDNNPQDYHGHGTFVSSVIAANFDNGIGIAGVIPKCKIMPVRVLDASGHGDQDVIAKGILYAVNNGAKAINFSIGGEGDSPALRSAFQTARDKGVPIIIAAGNDSLNLDAAPTYPAAYGFDNELVVAAHDWAGLLSSFSNYGATVTHLAAPGEGVLALGLPARKEFWKEDFEAANLDAWTQSAPGSFALTASAPIEAKQSLAWVSGVNVSVATAQSIDLTGKAGAVIGFQLDYRPANRTDALVLEGNVDGTATWVEIAVFPAAVNPDQFLSYGLKDFDGNKFKLRFRTAASLTASGRVLKIDGLSITVPDTNPSTYDVVTVVNGTSIAAPFVTAYVGLQRLACDRMGVPWSRAKALTGVVSDASLVGKVQNGNRLDVAKGLDFYLSTLPDIRIVDSTVVSWDNGKQVQYSLSLTPPPQQVYQLSDSGLGGNAAIDGAGKLTWTPAVDQVGGHTVTIMASGPTLLRKRFTFEVKAAVPVALRLNERIPKTLLYGGQKFLLRPGLAENGRHLVEIRGTDLTGKSHLLKKEWIEADALQHLNSLASASPQGVSEKPAGPGFARFQIDVDGESLPAGK